MRNVLLIAAEVIVCYIALIILSKKYKTDGIYIFGIIATFMSCIMCLKKISIMSVSVPIGYGVTTSLLLGGNLITQKRGTDEIKQYILLITITALVSCCFLNLTGMMESSEYNIFANKSFDSIFTYNIRTYTALIISLIISVWLSSKLYYLIKRIQNKIVISNIFSIIIVEFFENIAFVLIAYLFEYENIDLILCVVFRYMIKSLIGIIGTIPLYISNKNS